MTGGRNPFDSTPLFKPTSIDQISAGRQERSRRRAPDARTIVRRHRHNQGPLTMPHPAKPTARAHRRREIFGYCRAS